MDPDPDENPDPSIFIIDLEQKTNLQKVFCILLFDATFTSFFKVKKSQNSRNLCFSYYFYLMIEGFGSIPLTGSGTRRPDNTWIRIPNTAKLCLLDQDPSDPEL